MYIYNFDDVAEWWRKPILKYELKDINFKQKKRKNTEIKEFYVEKLIIMWKYFNNIFDSQRAIRINCNKHEK